MPSSVAIYIPRDSNIRRTRELRPLSSSVLSMSFFAGGILTLGYFSYPSFVHLPVGGPFRFFAPRDQAPPQNNLTHLPFWRR
jgi:hypothetical protein